MWGHMWRVLNELAIPGSACLGMWGLRVPPFHLLPGGTVLFQGARAEEKAEGLRA